MFVGLDSHVDSTGCVEVIATGGEARLVDNLRGSAAL